MLIAKKSDPVTLNFFLNVILFQWKKGKKNENKSLWSRTLRISNAKKKSAADNALQNLLFVTLTLASLTNAQLKHF